MKSEIIYREEALDCPDEVSAISLQREFIIGRGFLDLIENVDAEDEQEEFFSDPHLRIMSPLIGALAIEKYGLHKTIDIIDETLPELSRTAKMVIESIRTPNDMTRTFYVVQPTIETINEFNEDKQIIDKNFRLSMDIKLEPPIIGRSRQNYVFTGIKKLNDYLRRKDPIILMYGSVQERFHKVPETSVQ